VTARAGGTRPKRLHSDRSANFEICCARRTTGIAGYKVVVDPDTVATEINIDSRGPPRNRRSRLPRGFIRCDWRTRIHHQSLVSACAAPKRIPICRTFLTYRPELAAYMMQDHVDERSGDRRVVACRGAVGGEKPTVPSATRRERRRLAEAFDQGS
jgi:hypothetical protein